MKKILPAKKFQSMLMGLIFIGSTMSSFAQVEFRLVTTFFGSSSLHDVNNDGLALNGGQYYDFQTDSWIPLEADAVGLSYMNNNADVSGNVFYDEPNFILQPGFKLNGGNWEPIGWFPASNPSTDFFTTYGISPSGQYICGQMSTGGGVDFGSFLYDSVNGTLSEFWDPNGEALAAYDVNDDGVMVGWVDIPNGGGTNRTPAYFSASQGVNVIVNTTQAGLSTANNINANNIIVGAIDLQPFIYDLSTNDLTILSIPSGFNAAEFLDISENGIAIGLATTVAGDRDAIIYHPSLGADPVLLKDVLADFGVTINTFDGKLGTGFAISEDGNFLVGRDNQFFFDAQGWIVDFDDMLLEVSDCTIICPLDIEVDAQEGAYTAMVEYEITFECNGTTPAGTEIVLINGLPSGSEFPIGTTTQFFQLEDGDGNVLDSCSLDITVNDFFCNPSFTIAVEPITRVVFAGIDNTTSASPGAPANEYFFDIVGEVAQGETYGSALEGYTGGPFVDFFTIMIDWNQDFVFDSTEIYDGGSIENSTGEDGIQALSEVAVPIDALPGTTRLRILKNWAALGEDPCAEYEYGQTEDYLLDVIETTIGINDIELNALSVSPNPAKNQLTVKAGIPMNNIAIYDISGKLISSETCEGTEKTIAVGNLSAGIYFVRVNTGNTASTLKFIKH